MAEVHEILTRLRTELDPKGFEDAMKLLFDLEKAGLAFNKMLAVAGKQYLQFTDAAAEAIRGIRGPISKQVALTIAAKMGQAGYNKAMEEARKEIQRYISENEKLRTELDTLKKTLEGTRGGLIGLTRTKSVARKEIKTLADVIATLTRPEVEMLHKALTRLVWSGVKADEAVEHLVATFRKGKLVLKDTTFTAKEYVEMLSRQELSQARAAKLTEYYKDELEKLDKTFKEAERTASTFVRRLDLKTVALTAAGLAATAYVKFLKSAIAETARWAEETWKMSLMLGASEEEAIKFAAAAELVGLRASALVRPFSILLTQIRRVHKDTTSAVKITDEFGEVIGLSSVRLGIYGLALTDTEGRARPLWDIMADLSDIYIRLGKSTDALVLAQAAFGFQYRHLLPLLELGGERWRALGERLGDLSGLTEEHIDITMDYVFAQRELGIALRGFRMQLAVHILPLLTDFLKILAELISKYGDLSTEVKETTADILAILAALGATEIAKLALVKAIGFFIGKLGLAGTILGKVLGGILAFVTGLWKVVAVIGVVIGAIELLELALGREIIAWGDYIERLKEWISTTEEVVETAERVTFPPIPPAPPVPPFPWTPLLEQMAADYVEVWSKAADIARSQIEAELKEMGYTAEEVAHTMALAMAEARVAIAEFLAGTRDNVAISVRTLAGTVTFSLSQVLDFLRLQVEMVQAERAVEAARRAVADIRDSIAELRRHFREEVEARREQVELARERLAGAREAVAALRDQLRALRRQHREELEPYRERLELAKRRVEEAREALAAARDVLEEERERRKELEEAQRERIELAEDRLELARDEVERNKELLEELQERIDAEVEERLRLLGIIIDPTRLEALKDAVAEAKAQVEEAKSALEDARARRRRYGLMLVSWEEINAQAALEIAEQAQRQAEAALREEERRHRLAREVRREVEAQYAAEREQLEESIRIAEERVEELKKTVEAERERLEDLKERHKEELEVFEERVKQAEDRLKSEQKLQTEARKALEEVKKRHAEEIEALERRIELAEDAVKAQAALVRAEERQFREWRRVREKQIEADERRLKRLLRLREAELKREEANLERLKEEMRKRELIAKARQEAAKEFSTAMERHKKAMTIIEKLTADRTKRAAEEMRTALKETVAAHEERKTWLERLRDFVVGPLGQKVREVFKAIGKGWSSYLRLMRFGFFRPQAEMIDGLEREVEPKVKRSLSDIGRDWSNYEGWVGAQGALVYSAVTAILALITEPPIETIKMKFQEFASWLSSLAGKVSEKIASILALIFREPLATIALKFSDFQAWLSSLKDKVAEKIGTVLSWTQETFSDWLKTISGKFSDFKTWLSSLKSHVALRIGAVLEWLPETFKEWLKTIKEKFESFKDWLEDLYDAIKNYLKPVIDFISRLVKTVKDIFDVVFGKHSPALAEIIEAWQKAAVRVEMAAIRTAPLEIAAPLPTLRPRILAEALNVYVTVEGIPQPVRIKTEIEPPALTYYETFR